MSNSALNWALAQKVSPRDKLVLVVLANRANDNHECWPSMASLIEDTSMSERGVQEAVKALRLCGLVMIDGGGGRARTNLYRLAVSETPQNTSETPQKSTNTPRDLRGNDDAETPQNLQETPQNTSETPQDLQKTPHSLHPEPKVQPIEPKKGTQRIGRDDADLFAGDGAKPKREKRSKARTQIPADWWPDDGGLAFASARQVDPAIEVPRFRDYHVSRGNLMADWAAAWRTWCQNQVQFGRVGRVGAGAGDGRPSRMASAAAALMGVNIRDPTDRSPIIDLQPDDDWRKEFAR